MRGWCGVSCRSFREGRPAVRVGVGEGARGIPRSAIHSEVSHASDRFGEQALSGLSQNSSSRTPGCLLRVSPVGHVIAPERPRRDMSGASAPFSEPPFPAKRGPDTSPGASTVLGNVFRRMLEA